MSNNSSETRAFGADDEQALGEEDAALNESGTHPVALRPSYRPVAKSANEETPPIAEDVSTTQLRTVVTELLAVVDKCAARLRGRW
jgi:hypothetical protein